MNQTDDFFFLSKKKKMNSQTIRAINNPLKIDEMSISNRTYDLSNSWKLEKQVDNKGRSNYKLVTDTLSEIKSQRKSQKKKNMYNNSGIGAYGVPGNKSYLLNKTPTLNSSGVLTQNTTVIKKIKKSPFPAISENQKQINDLSEESVRSLKNDIEQIIERVCDTKDIIHKNMIIGNNHQLISYENGNDLLKKSYYHAHLLTNNIYLQNLHILLSYIGNKKIPYMTISIWSQLFSPHLELINVLTIPVKNIESNHGKLIVKEIQTDIIQKGQLFLTVNCPEEYKGYMCIKYNIELIQIFEVNKEMDVLFEFPSFFAETVLEPKQNPPEEVKVVEPIVEIIEKEPEPIINLQTPIIEPITVNPKQELPSLDNNLFGDFITRTNKKKIPIFSETPRKNVSKLNQNDTSHFSFLQATNAEITNDIPHQALGDITEEEPDFTEKDENDIHQLLSILRNQ